MLKELIFPWSSPPEPGTATELAPQVFERTDSALKWIRMPLPFALDHINLWLMRHGEGWCVVDCGYGSEVTRGFWAQQFATTCGNLPVTQIVVTHYHPDHIGNAQWLSEKFGAPVAMSYTEFVTAHALTHSIGPFEVKHMAAFYKRHGVGDAMLPILSDRRVTYSSGVPELPQSISRIRPGETISLGGHDWQAIAGYGHTQEHIAFYCDALRVLISGDMLLPKISTNVNVWPIDPTADAVGMFLDSLDEFAELPEDTLVLPSHGLPFRGIRVRVKALHEHHKARMAELVEALDTPKCAYEILPVLFRRPLDNHQTFFAIGEAVAHLNHGIALGTLKQIQGDDGILRSVRA
jgi:glyoxylase-like metal-dependent hydrolase (beta-lactamase superfamily II)